MIEIFLDCWSEPQQQFNAQDMVTFLFPVVLNIALLHKPHKKTTAKLIQRVNSCNLDENIFGYCVVIGNTHNNLIVSLSNEQFSFIYFMFCFNI